MRISSVRPPVAATLTWIALAALLLAVLAASLWAVQPPVPAPRDAPLSRFSEGRARDIVGRLSDEIGFRVNGTEAHGRAAELLATELRKIPRLEVELQTVSGTQVYRTAKLPPFVYKTINVVARLPGRSPEAILLDAHFDTLVDSVGAADDAAGVAAIVEAVRVLAREPTLGRTVVINLNGGEEAGLFGAAGFLRHRWARDVRAYLYLEALPGGKATLVGAGPGNPWLAEVYGRVAPSPVANVVGQDLVQSGVLPHNGDFTPFHEAGLRGLDVAMTGDGWAYHTALDRATRLQPGGLQHMGDTTVAVTRALANRATPPDQADAEPVVYYDILGVFMIVYRGSAGRALAVGGGILAGISIMLLRRRGLVTLGGVVLAFGWTLLAVLAGLMAATGAGALLATVLGRPHGWFSAPVLVLPAFAAPALAAMLGVHALWRRRALRRVDVDHHMATAAAGALVFWSLLLALAAVANLGAGYLALHWVLGAAAGLISSLFFPRVRGALTFICLVPGAVVTIEVGVFFLKYFIPITGMLPAARPLDFLVAALVGVVTASVGVVALVVPQRVGGYGRAAICCAGVAILGVVLTAVHFPYTTERPKRLLLVHAADDRNSALLLAAGDPLGMAPLLGSIPDFVPARPGWPRFEIWSPWFTHELAAAAPALDPPRLDVMGDEYDATTDKRILRVRVAGSGAQLRLRLPSARLLGWSLAPSPEATISVDGQHVAHFEGLDADGQELSLTIRGRAPLPIELRAIDRRPAGGPLVDAVKRRLPPWTTTTSAAMRVTRLDL